MAIPVLSYEETWINLAEHGGTWWNMVEHGGTWRKMEENGGTGRKMIEHGKIWPNMADPEHDRTRQLCCCLCCPAIFICIRRYQRLRRT